MFWALSHLPIKGDYVNKVKWKEFLQKIDFCHTCVGKEHAWPFHHKLVRNLYNSTTKKIWHSKIPAANPYLMWPEKQKWVLIICNCESPNIIMTLMLPCTSGFHPQSDWQKIGKHFVDWNTREWGINKRLWVLLHFLFCKELFYSGMNWKSMDVLISCGPVKVPSHSGMSEAQD